jgi:hypothetical protein
MKNGERPHDTPPFSPGRNRSINPSAIVVTLYLLSRERVSAQVVVYVAAIFLTYLSLGVLMMLDPMLLLWVVFAASWPHRALVGLGLMVYGLTLSAITRQPQRSRPSRPPMPPRDAGRSVTAMELPMAMPYFAAIALITEAGLLIRTWALPLGTYNVIFVLRRLPSWSGILSCRTVVEIRCAPATAESGARETVLWVAGLVGGALRDGLIELVARLRR